MGSGASTPEPTATPTGLKISKPQPDVHPQAVAAVEFSTSTKPTAVETSTTEASTETTAVEVSTTEASTETTAVEILSTAQASTETTAVEISKAEPSAKSTAAEISTDDMAEILSKIQLVLDEVKVLESSVNSIKANLNGPVIPEDADQAAKQEEPSNPSANSVAPVVVSVLPPKVDIFISIRVATMLPTARKFRELCTAKGFTTWMCIDLEQGTSYRRDIITMVGRCRAFVPLIDKAWASSGECEYEFNVATRYCLVKKCPALLPFMMEDLDMGDYPLVAGLLANTNAIFAYGDFEKAFVPFYEQNKDMFPKTAPIISSESSTAPAPPPAPATQPQTTKPLMPSGAYIGYFIDARTGADRWPMELNLIFKKGTFAGWGKDSIGTFEILNATLTPTPEGDPEGDVASLEFTKQYFQAHSIYYRGTIRSGQLVGVWAFWKGDTPGGSFVLFPDTDE